MEVFEGTDVDISVLHLEVEQAEGHLQLDGELDIGEKHIEAHAQGVAQVVGLEADDALVGAVEVLAQRGEVEAIAAPGGEVGAEIEVAAGAEFDFQRYVAVYRLHIAAALGEGVGAEVALFPGVADIARDDGHAGQQAQGEPVVEAEVADDGDMESRGVVGCDPLE